MKKSRFWMVLAMLAFIFSASVMAKDSTAKNFMADQHKARGVICQQCHGDAKPGEVSSDTCLVCHGSFEKLKTSEKTKKLHPNPHDGHYIDLDCGNCHHGHKADENFCDSCHAKK